MQSTPSARDDVAFYAHRFVASRYRGRAHLPNDLARFAAVYRIPGSQRSAVFRLVDALVA